MASAQIPLKLGSEIVINSAFVILSHNSPKPTMNSPSANANKSLFQRQGNFQIIGCISKGKSTRKFRLEKVADHAKYSKKGKAELSFFVLKATCSQGNLQIFQPTEALTG